MSYRVVYDPQLNQKYAMRRSKSPRKKAVGMGIGLVVLLVAVLMTPVRDTVLDYLLPGDKAATKAAISHLVQQVESGEPLGQAVTVFCQEILQGV